MKLNNGKGWEAMKAHPSAAHLHHGGPHQNSSTAVNIGGHPKVQRPLNPHLDKDLPKPGATRGHTGGRGVPRDMNQPPKYHPDPASKRQSKGDLAPEGSAVAQYVNSNQHLPSNRMTPQPSPLAAGAQQQQVNRQPERKEGFGKKMARIFCCAS